MAQYSDKDAHRRVLEIAENLHGLSLLEADHVLSEVRKLLCHVTQFDMTGAAYREFVQSYNATTGDDHPVKQSQ